VAERDFEHLLGRRHFEVERDGKPFDQLEDIIVAYMSPVFAQMGGDTIGAGGGGGEGGAHRIGVIATAGVTDRRDMVDIDPQAERIGHAAARLPGFSGGNAASAAGSASAE
jgi:hypothetical protein